MWYVLIFLIIASTADAQEIPESVTEELEKLEEEGVGSILAEIGDDDELLGKLLFDVLTQTR